MSKKPSIWHKYNGRSVLVFDNFFSKPAIEKFGEWLKGLEYTSRPSFDNELSCGFSGDEFRSIPLFYPKIRGLIKTYYSRMSKRTRQQQLSHAYGASLKYGDHTIIHRDANCPDCVSFLYYGNLSWDPAWGGETVFFDDKKNAIFAVTPKPGRLVFFNAGLYHRTGIPMRDCPTNRYGISIFFRCANQLKHEQKLLNKINAKTNN